MWGAMFKPETASTPTSEPKMNAPPREVSGDPGAGRFSASAVRRPPDRRGLRPDVRRARADLRRHAGDQFRPGRFHDARHVRGVLFLHRARRAGHVRQHLRTVRRDPAGRPGAGCVRLLRPPYPDLARIGHAHLFARGRRSLCPAHSDAGDRADPAEWRPARIRLGAGLDPDAAVEFGVGAWTAVL